MLFSSPTFFIFFSLYLLLHAFLPARFRMVLIIVGSTIFYAYWNPRYVFLPYILTLLSFYGTLWTMGKGTHSQRKTRLAVTILLLFVPLFFFKYTNFLYSNTIALLTGKAEKVLDLSLPLGVSFVTFTLIAYTVDVWRGKYPVERKLSRLLGCVFFFPHLIAGPIVRPSQLIPQLSRYSTLKIDRQFLLGFFIFSIGLFKKLVLADPIAAAVDPIFSSTESLSRTHYLFAMFGFTAQIYLDFSGYTDMALGCARVLGVRLPKNFDRPYISTSIIEFWKRWHISLSLWLRDYLYIPLGGNRTGKAKQMRNLLITMGLGGLWHGANWTFVIWGLYHGLGLAALHTARARQWVPRLPSVLSWVLTFVFAAVGWVFFRAPDWTVAKLTLVRILTNEWGAVGSFAEANAFALLAMFFAFAVHRMDNHAHWRLYLRKMPLPLSLVLIVLLFLLSITISAGSSSQFIYFEF